MSDSFPRSSRLVEGEIYRENTFDQSSPGKLAIGVGVAIGVGIEVLYRKLFDPDTDTDSDADETLTTIFIPGGEFFQWRIHERL